MTVSTLIIFGVFAAVFLGLAIWDAAASKKKIVKYNRYY